MGKPFARGKRNEWEKTKIKETIMVGLLRIGSSSEVVFNKGRELERAFKYFRVEERVMDEWVYFCAIWFNFSLSSGLRVIKETIGSW